MSGGKKEKWKNHKLRILGVVLSSFQRNTALVRRNSKMHSSATHGLSVSFAPGRSLVVVNEAMPREEKMGGAQAQQREDKSEGKRRGLNLYI